MEKVFELMGSHDAQKVNIVVYLLQDCAFDWWLIEQRRKEKNPNPVTWERFKTSLTEKYFPRTIRVQKKRDIIRLEQEDGTLVKYEGEFARLSKYASTFGTDKSN